MKAKTVKYKTHTQLKITFAEYGALFGTWGLLASGALKHDVKNKRWPDHDDHLFNMDIPCTQNGCGSVSCIGGTMGIMMGLKYPDTYVIKKRSTNYPEGHSPVLFDLFFPSVKLMGRYETITDTHACKVIQQFLTTGVIKW